MEQLATYLDARAALQGAAIRHAIGAMRMGKYTEAERVLRAVAAEGPGLEKTSGQLQLDRC